MGLLAMVGAILKPVARVFEAREARKIARGSANAKLATAKQNGDMQITFNDQELEAVNAAAKKESWLDEFVTVSLFAVFWAILVGAVAGAFGRPEILQGIAVAVATLTEIGVDVGFLLEAVTLSAVGLTVWRRF